MGRAQVCQVVLGFLLSLLVCARAEEGKQSALKLVFAGDVLLAGQAGQIMLKRGTAYPFAKVKPTLAKADLAFCNLECALTGKVVTRNVRRGKRKWFVFKAPPKLGQALVDGGIDVVSLANNHAMNGGRAGLLSTMDTLKSLDIKAVGAGRNQAEARSCRTFTVKGRTVSFLAYADIGGPAATAREPGIARLGASLPQALKEIETAKRKADLVVVSYHWGVEGRTKPSARQQTVAQQSIDAGADLVIGHHPHVLQPVMVYKGKTIAYSIGNFVFDNPRPIVCRSTLLQVEIDENGKQRVEQIPCRIRNAQPNPRPAGQAHTNGGRKR